MTHGRRYSIAATLAAALAASPAAAEPTAAQRADALFRSGRELVAGGRLAEACDAFAQSDALDPAPTTEFALAVCREKTGQLATARALYIALAAKLAGATAATDKQVRAAAAANLAKLEPRVSHLTLEVAPAARVPGLTIYRGDALVPAEQWNVAAPVDGGEITLRAEAPGHTAWTQLITVGAERDVRTVQIPELPLPIAPPSVEPAPAARPAPPPAHRKTASLALPIGVTAAALGLGLGALAFDLSGDSTYEQAKAAPDGSAQQASLWASANHRRYAAEGFGVAAVASAGLAVWLFTRAGHREPSAARASLAPVIAPGGVGLVVAGSY